MGVPHTRTLFPPLCMGVSHTNRLLHGVSHTRTLRPFVNARITWIPQGHAPSRPPPDARAHTPRTARGAHTRAACAPTCSSKSTDDERAATHTTTSHTRAAYAPTRRSETCAQPRTRPQNAHTHTRTQCDESRQPTGSLNLA